VFDKPLYARRRYFVQEINGLIDVFYFLDAWPQEKRDLVYQTLARYCHEAASGRLPIYAVWQCLFRQSNTYGHHGNERYAVKVNIRREDISMKKTVTTLLAMTFVAAALASCGNTIRGMGQDTANTVDATQNAGKRVDRAARY